MGGLKNPSSILCDGHTSQLAMNASLWYHDLRIRTEKVEIDTAILDTADQLEIPMKPVLHFIWSPFLFSLLGFLMACKIVDIMRIEPLQRVDRTVNLLLLVVMPAVGLVVGWVLAYLATPIPFITAETGEGPNSRARA